MSLYSFYYKYFKVVSILLFYILIGLAITILVVNNKLYYASEKNEDINNFEDNLKTQKILIWTNFSIIIFFFLSLLIISFHFFKYDYEAIHERRKVLIRTIMLGCLIIITIGLTYYINNTLNGMNISNSKEESNKIFIIVPFLSIISILLLMRHFSNTDAALTRMRNITYERLYSEPVNNTLHGYLLDKPINRFVVNRFAKPSPSNSSNYSNSPN